MSRACCFTGHRSLPPEDSQDYRDLCQRLQQAIETAVSSGCTVFYAGGAIGFDMLAAECVLQKAESHRQGDSKPVSLILCVPFIGHNDSFSKKDKRRFSLLTERAAEVRYLSDHPSRFAYTIRNQYMVNRSDLCIAYVRELQSGSGQTLRLAKKNNLSIILI